MKKERLTLKFSEDKYAHPITYHLVKDYDLKINILKAEITPGQKGHLLIDLEGEDGQVAAALDYLRATGIQVVPVERQTSVEKEACIHCGACTGVCFSGAMEINRQDWRVEFLPEHCIACGLCVDACPLGIITSSFGVEGEGV